MKIQRCFTIHCALLLLPVLLIASFATAEDKKKDNAKDACANPNPASLCSADNTCGSASAPCTVNVKRTSYSSSATPSIPVSYTHLRAHETVLDLVCRLLLEK